MWSIIGVLVSVIGLAIAIKQVRELSDRTKAIDDTYKQTIKDLENRDTISNISTALQKVESLKLKIRENKISELLNELTPVAKLLVILCASTKENYGEINLEKHQTLCNDLEIKIITQENITKNSLKDELISLSELELILTDLQSKIRYNKKTN
jgi:hypothetical protein